MGLNITSFVCVCECTIVSGGNLIYLYPGKVLYLYPRGKYWLVSFNCAIIPVFWSYILHQELGLIYNSFTFISLLWVIL